MYSSGIAGNRRRTVAAITSSSLVHQGTITVDILIVWLVEGSSLYPCKVLLSTKKPHNYMQTINPTEGEGRPSKLM